MKKIIFIFLTSLSSFNIGFSQSIILHEKNATVWSQNQIINGKVKTFFNNVGELYLNGNPIPFNISSADSSFSVPIKISKGENIIYIQIDSSGTEIISDTLHYTLGYKPMPILYAYATVSGRNVSLHAKIIENPDSVTLSYFWETDSSNPSDLNFTNNSDTLIDFSIPQNASLGEYYFNLIVSTSNNDTAYARTFITVDSSEIKPFNIETDHAAWIDSAVLYEVTPYIFVANGKFKDIVPKIPELQKLGINTLWIQPTFPTQGGGQGYDVTNYFGIRSDYGTSADLKNLIASAKSHGMKVIFDIPINHSSISHPYAQNSIKYGTDSHYYDFYQRQGQNLNVPYSQYYHYDNGFVNYFWEYLPNLNYDNPEVQKWITEACKYWIEKYGIDGYRFDAVWGVNARRPDFTQNLRLALKRIKPEILMLAEDKATWQMVFDKRFDAAYDWSSSESWISHWAWQVPNNDPTIFNNSNQNIRSQLLRNALTNDGNGYASNAIILRFLENNDTDRFIALTDLLRTKMAAALEFTVNGIPLIYNGQETGKIEHPYDAYRIYLNGISIQQSDAYGLFPYYEKLTSLRKSFPALYSKNFSELSVTPNNYVFSFRRWERNQNIICAINMGNTDVNAVVSIPVESLNLDSSKTYYLTDMLNGDVISGKPGDLSSTNISLTKYTTRIFLLADTIMTVTGIKNLANMNLPQEFKLEQNYPNPFNPSTSIQYSVGSIVNGTGKQFVSLKVYDILGKEVASLVNKEQKKGSYEVQFSADQLSSGVYFYQLKAGSFSQTKKMILLK